MIRPPSVLRPVGGVILNVDVSIPGGATGMVPFAHGKGRLAELPSLR
jgi:hypothetical protein